MEGFARVSVAVPQCRVADVQLNGASIEALWRQAHEEGSALVVFPELSLCGYTARDLLLSPALLSAVERELCRLAEVGRTLGPLALIGAPLRSGHGVFNCALALQEGRILACVPKTFLPNYREFEERRWFRSGAEVPAESEVQLGPHRVPFGTDLLLEGRGIRDFCVGVEICEDAWVQHPPSAAQVSAGATVCANLSASNFVLGKAETRRSLVESLSLRGHCAYLYVAAGPGESSTDLAFDADAFIVERGAELCRSQRFSREPQLLSADIDLGALAHARRTTPTFGDAAQLAPKRFRRVSFSASAPAALRRAPDPHPFLPKDPQTLARRCWEIFEIQTHALLTRMRALGAPPLVLGVSGGLDSTQAALVCAAALDLAGRPRRDLLCATLPGLGTSAGTRSHAEALAEALGARFVEIPIHEATQRVLAQSGHAAAQGTADVAALLARLRSEPTLGDVALENVQARLRTLWLMTLANQEGGLLVGTGDLSEKALGWSTYNGDHLSMYDVNAGVPKTLIQFVIRWVARERARLFGGEQAAALCRVLEAILATPISPELLPPDPEGRIAQHTEETLGPYELHDFFLWHFVRDGASPTRILDLARHAFGDRYDVATLKRWLGVFVGRFFSQQFKRSATADAPKVCAVALSPRGDWRMPSDASPRAFLAEIDAYPDTEEG